MVSEAGGGKSEPEKLARHSHRTAGHRGGPGADRDVRRFTYSTG